MDNMTPAELATNLRLIKLKRKEAEDYAEKCKEMEGQLQEKLLQYLDSQGAKSVKLDGVGTVTKTVRTQVQIEDNIKLCEFIQKRVHMAEADGLPIAEAINLYQQRAAQGNILKLIEEGVKPEEIGVRIVENFSISLTK